MSGSLARFLPPPAGEREWSGVFFLDARTGTCAVCAGLLTRGGRVRRHRDRDDLVHADCARDEAVREIWRVVQLAGKEGARFIDVASELHGTVARSAVHDLLIRMEERRLVAAVNRRYVLAIQDEQAAMAAWERRCPTRRK